MALQSFGYVIGRAGLASLFILGGLNKLISGDGTIARLQHAGLEPASLFLWLTIGLELGAGLALALGTRIASSAALALAAFTLATNALFHQFWALEGEIASLELSLFFKNVAIAGGLLALASIEQGALNKSVEANDTKSNS
ncbi:MAG: DoxX family membrane protein [Pseudomonadota bacterium]